MINFCKCGRVLDILYNNKRWDRKYIDFCNDKCKSAYERKIAIKNQKHYGVTGDLYMHEKRIVVLKKEGE